MPRRNIDKPLQGINLRRTSRKYADLLDVCDLLSGEDGPYNSPTHVLYVFAVQCPYYYKYVAVLQRQTDRKALKAELRETYGVSLAGEVYEEPIQRQPVFERYAGYPLPASEGVCAGHVCLPVFSGMTDEQAHQVVDALKRTLG